MTQQHGTHAIVIGGSIAGMLNARVLSDHFDTVTILERDAIAAAPEYRGGVPQGRHLHTLLARGQRILETMFPGLAEDIDACGATKVRWGIDTNFVTIGGELPRFDGKYETHLISRTTLEHLVRNRLAAYENIQWRTNTQVDELVGDSHRIKGVKLSQRRTKAVDTLMADLVVDASGRGSKSPEWLRALGYEVPEETVVDAHVGYATRWYKLSAAQRDAFASCTMIQADAANGLYRQGAMFRVEDDRYVLTLQGSSADYPPTDDTGFAEFARSLATRQLYNFIQVAEPISPVYGYRRTRSRLRHYHKLRNAPENYLVTGDAACAFNPVFGQGMSMAAIEAEMLSQLLTRYNGDYTGLAAIFQKQLRALIDSSWTLATAEDMRYPATEGDEPGMKIRFMQHYSDWVAETMCYDETIAHAFFHVFNLMRPADSLMHPRIFARVLWHKFLHRKSQRLSQITDTGASPQVLA